jgi:hypothetical protein
LFTPGTSWQYSGGYTIIQMALEDTFKPIAVASDYIFSPIGMNNTMIQPNENGFLTNVLLFMIKTEK